MILTNLSRHFCRYFCVMFLVGMFACSKRMLFSVLCRFVEVPKYLQHPLEYSKRPCEALHVPTSDITCTIEKYLPSKSEGCR